MNTAARNRCSGIRSFVVCFYCNENFRSLSSLFKHCCSAEAKTIFDVDLSQEDWEPPESFADINDVDLSQEDKASAATVSDTNECNRRQENSVRTESVSAMSNVYENSQQISEGEQPVSGTRSDASDKQLSKTISDLIEELADLASDASEKLSPGANMDVVVCEGADLASDASEKQLSIATLGTEKKTEVEPNADDDFNISSPDLVSKVLQYYEKQTNQGTPDSCCKSPPTEIEFHSLLSPLSNVESSSPKYVNTQMKCISTDVCKKGMSSNKKNYTYEEDIIQKESDALEQEVKDLESYDSNKCSRPSSPEVDSSDRLSRSSSIGMDLNSLGCGDDQSESNDSDVCTTLSLSEKTSNELKRDCVQEELQNKKINNKSLSEENLNIRHGSVILKPCYVMVKDVFKSLSNFKLSPKKGYSWKKKYHVCDVCDKFFRLRSDLNLHYLIHTSVKPYVCNLCGKSFIKQSNLFAHHLAHTIARNHKCSVCKKTFPKRSLLLRHKVVHTKEKPFACDKCNKSYTVKSSLNEHYLSHSEEKPFSCEICSASFNNKRYLRKHYYKHQTKEYVCEFCFKSFKRKHHLDEHYNIHVNDKPNVCNICGKSFHLLLTLNNHIYVAHPKERDVMLEQKMALADYQSKKDPVIQRIEKSTIVDKDKKTHVIKIEKSAKVDKGEKSPFKKNEKLSVDKSKETVTYSTRRKSSTPRKYLQSD